jgi:hypothetical protein
MLRYKVEVLKRKQTNNQDLAPEMAPGQYIYHPACHCSRCREKRQATSNKPQATSRKRGGGELARKSSSATGLHDDVIISPAIPNHLPSLTDFLGFVKKFI